MKRNKGLIATLILGFISFIFIVMDFLALHDIYTESGKYDVSGEWTIVIFSFIPIIAFHILFVIYIVIPFLNKEINIYRYRKNSKQREQSVSPPTGARK